MIYFITEKGREKVLLMHIGYEAKDLTELEGFILLTVNAGKDYGGMDINEDYLSRNELRAFKSLVRKGYIEGI